MANPTLLNTTDTDKIQNLLADTEENVAYFDSVAKNLVESETSHMDQLMRDIYTDLNVDDIPITKLERYYLELTNLLYFMGEKLERLSTRADLSKAAAKETYNKAYLANMQKDCEGKNKRTIAENQAVAETSSMYETTVNNIYEHAYKMVSYKIDAGYEMVKTLSKLITRRMQETELSKNQRNVKSGFNFDPDKQILIE